MVQTFFDEIPKMLRECQEGPAHRLDACIPQRGLLIRLDGSTEYVKGPFDGEMIRDLIGCVFFQCIPCTQPIDGVEVVDKFDIWVDEDPTPGLGRPRKQDSPLENETPCLDVNVAASAVLGCQVYGKELFGNVLVLPTDQE